MDVLDAQAVADDFPLDGASGAVLGPIFSSAGGYYNVGANPVYVQYAYGNYGEYQWTPPVPIPVGPAILAAGTVAVRFRNYTAGQAAVVSGALSEKSEPVVTITSGGVSTPSAGSGLQLIQKIGPLTAAQATLDFQGIPATFAALALEVVARGTGAGADILMTFNGDAAAADYSGERIQGTGGAASATEILPGALAGIDIGGVAIAASPAGSAGVFRVDIPDYAETTFQKAIVANSFARQAVGAGGMVRQAWGGVWLNTAAIARLTLALSAGNFDVGSSATLFGLPAS